MNILFIILAFVISASVARLIIPRILLISLRKKLFDMPSERKVHKRAIPRLGGVSFFPTILLSSCGVFALRILMGYDVPVLGVLVARVLVSGLRDDFALPDGYCR